MVRKYEKIKIDDDTYKEIITTEDIVKISDLENVKFKLNEKIRSLESMKIKTVDNKDKLLSNEQIDAINFFNIPIDNDIKNITEEIEIYSLKINKLKE